jgi:hypothetical protein
VERDAPERSRPEDLSVRRVERAQLGRVRLRRRISRLDRLRLWTLTVHRHVLRRVPDRVREPDVLRDEQQRAQELQQRSFHTRR